MHLLRRPAWLAAALAVVALAAPAAASAASSTQTDWTLRSSWVSYVSNPLWANAQPITTSWSSLGSNTYAVPVDTGSSTSTVREHTGGIAFDVDAHGIHITIDDLKLTRSGTDVVVNADVSYDPLVGPVVSDNRDLFYFTVPSGSGTFNDRTAYLTAGGAEVFNGGSNGSYEEDEAWGDFSVALP